MDIETIHHVSLTVSDLERSTAFYSEILGLRQIERPPFSFPGAWFQVGTAQQLHLIVSTTGTFRTSDKIDTRDIHFAIRVKSYREALGFLESKGYSTGEMLGDRLRLVAHPHATAGFPQIYILDPDRHVIEINAAALD